VGVAYDEGDAGKRGNFFWSALGVAAGDDDLSVGIGSVEFADRVTGLSIGGCSDGAGVYHNDVGGDGGGRDGTTAIEELTLDGGSVGLGGAAAELFDVKGGHRRNSLPFTGCG